VTNDDVHDFLRSRRARITPEMVGLSPGGGTRRVPGLRREEVALLAGISVDYYNRFERGNLAGASESVLDSLARALRLDDAERAHLFDLARAASSGPRIGRRRSTPKLRASVQQLLDGMTTIPAFVQNGRLDVLGMNDLARALYHRDEDPEAKPQNFARYLFLDPASIDELADWRGMAEDVVAILRQEAGRDPHSTELSNLIGELSTRSSDFRSMWASHRVRFHRTGTKQFHHPDVGDLELSFEAMQLPGDDGLTLIAYSAEPGTRSHDALALLASLRATARRQESPAAVRTQDRS
jgi:transcriptional regulator with XRE-family HTH domain